MKMNHVHFARGLSIDNGVTSRMHINYEMMIYLDVRKNLQYGMKFFINEKKMILTYGLNDVVPPKISYKRCGIYVILIHLIFFQSIFFFKLKFY